MDEADRILNMDFEKEVSSLADQDIHVCYCMTFIPYAFYTYQVDKLLKVIPKERRTYLFSATMTKKVSQYQVHHHSYNTFLMERTFNIILKIFKGVKGQLREEFITPQQIEIFQLKMFLRNFLKNQENQKQ